MKRLHSNRIGIDQGEVELFSDFANGGEMWTGSGARERRKRVTFSEGFTSVPTVQVGLSLWDVDSGPNVRADLFTDNVDLKGFDMVFRTWGDSRVARVRMSWIAMGEVTSEDDWVL